MNKFSIVAVLALAACSHDGDTVYQASSSTTKFFLSSSCGAGNSLCAPGGRPRVIVLPGGTTGPAPSGYFIPKGGR